MQNIPRAAHGKNTNRSHQNWQRKSQRKCSLHQIIRTKELIMKFKKWLQRCFCFKIKVITVTTTITGRNKKKNTTTAGSIVLKCDTLLPSPERRAGARGRTQSAEPLPPPLLREGRRPGSGEGSEGNICTS